MAEERKREEMKREELKEENVFEVKEEPAPVIVEEPVSNEPQAPANVDVEPAESVQSVQSVQSVPVSVDEIRPAVLPPPVETDDDLSDDSDLYICL